MNRIRQVFLILLFAGICNIINAQTPLPDSALPQVASQNSITKTCSFDIRQHKFRKDPSYVAQENAMNIAIRQASRNATDTIIMIPVVVHIINQNPFTITDATVISAIAQLNDAYGKTGAYTASPGADTRIRFCLAKQDPEGGNTTGITRTSSFWGDDLNMENEDDKLKNIVIWDPVRYVNIWVVSSIHGEAYAFFRCGQWIRSGVGGYATLPPNGSPTDGLVVAGLGANLLAHEMGHYLGLYHTFEGGCTNWDCNNNGDRVCDTPPDNEVLASPSCAAPDNSCTTDTLSAYSNGNFPVDVPDQISNFMDYGNGGCTIQFTQGQADRMRAAINTSRIGLLENKCNAPCAENILASFTMNIAHPLPGDLVNFTNTSTVTSTYEWYVDGVLIANTINFSYTFPAIGEYKVLLKAYNVAGCFASSSSKVIINCGVTARFYFNKIAIASLLNVYEDSIVFTNVSQNATNYQWLISNDQGMPQTTVSTNPNLTYVFPSPANYTIILVASAGTCSDTTSAFVVPVTDPTCDGSPYTMSAQCFNLNTIKVSFCLANYGIASLPAGTPVSFYDGNPYLATTNLLLPKMYLPSDVVGGNCFTCFTHLLNVDYRNIDRVYMVFNDSGNVVPISLPNAPLIEKSYFNNIRSTASTRTTVNMSICAGQSFSGYTTSGTYVDTLFSVVNGCAIIRTLNLTVRTVYNTNITLSICQGQTYAGYAVSGTYVDVFTSSNGCDSTRTLRLTVKPKSFKTLNISICQGDNFDGYTATGTYLNTYTAANGCDSIRTLNLVVKNKVFTSFNTSICEGQSSYGHSTTGIYNDIFTGANGCDSVRTLNLTVRPKKYSTVITAICQGQNFLGYTTSGTFVDVFTGVNGCDSTRTLQLTVKQPVTSNYSVAICRGQNYAGYTTSGIYTDVFTGANGCDSTRTVNLTVKPVFNTTYNIEICQGFNYAGYSTSGVYVNVFTAVNGCDSTRNLNLIVHPKKFTILPVEICIGERHFAQGQWQTQSGNYYDTLRTVYGCDSIIKTELIVHPLPVPDLGADANICFGNTTTLNPGSFAGYVWQNGDINATLTVNSTGTYHVLVTDSNGCKAADTMIILQIIPLPKEFLPEDTTVCTGTTFTVKVPGYAGYLWSNGETDNTININTPDLYLLQVKNLSGCVGSDSVRVDFETCIPIQVPSAFTPDGDHLNDYFKPLIPMAVSDYTLQVYNRLGQMLFETHDPGKGWNGMYKYEKQPTAAYIYLITLKDRAGSFIKKKGSFILIR